MANEDVATRAPESDAAEQSVLPGDTKAQEGPSMGEHCIVDRPTPAGEKPTGEITKIGDVDVGAYIAKPSDYPHAPSKLLILLTGGTGIRSTNNQIQADKYAREGFLVVMPDQFAGDPIPSAAEVTFEDPDQNASWLEHIKVRAAETLKSFQIDTWLARHTPEKVLPRLHRVIDGAREEFADAVANGGGIYAVGYCFGAKYVLLLAGEHLETVHAPSDEEQGAPKKAAIIKAGAIAHGTDITKEDIEGIKVPISMVCVQNDNLFPDTVREAGREALEKKGIEHEINIFPEVPHGFAVFGEYPDQKIKDAQSQAFTQMLNWLQSH